MRSLMILMLAQIIKIYGHRSGVTHTATLQCKPSDSAVGYCFYFLVKTANQD